MRTLLVALALVVIALPSPTGREGRGDEGKNHRREDGPEGQGGED